MTLYLKRVLYQKEAVSLLISLYNNQRPLHVKWDDRNTQILRETIFNTVPRNSDFLTFSKKSLYVDSIDGKRIFVEFASPIIDYRRYNEEARDKNAFAKAFKECNLEHLKAI